MNSTKRRLYISSDIEGVAGVVSMEHLAPSGFEYQRAREWMTAEVNAACEAAFNSGFDEVVVSDSHGNGQSLLIDQLPENVEVIRSWPRPLGMMDGIQEGSYEAAMLLGYHSGASNLYGVLAHTLHLGITEVRINGLVASETVISSAIAAHFDVPVVLVSGDDAYIDHAQEVLPAVPWIEKPCFIEGVVSKYYRSFTSAKMINPKQVQQRMYEQVASVLARLDEFKVRPIAQPIELDVVCLKRNAAELLEYLPEVERIDACTIRFVSKDMVEVSRFLSFLLASGSLTPK